MRKHYIAIVQAGPSACSVSFPDFPGVVTAARTVDAAVERARHEVAILGVALAVVDHGEGSRRIAERWMGGDIFHHLTTDIDAPAVADTVEILLAGHQH